MKKITLFSLSLISVLSVKAQITINSSGLINQDEKYISYGVDSITSFGGSGANQIWNFSSWISQQNSDTLFPQAASFGPAYSSFPSANLFVGDSITGGVYYNKSSSAFELLGFKFDFGFSVFNPPLKFLSFPSTYLTSYNSFYTSEIAFFIGQGGVDSAKAVDTVAYSSIIDSWGTITTPAVSNVNCIRQKFTEVSTSTQYIKITGQSSWTFSSQDTATTNISYRWFSDIEKSIVAEVNTDEFNQILGGSYLFLTIPAGNSNAVNERTTMESDITVFPNPAADKINIAGVSQASELFIYDINGKLMEATIIKKANYSLSLSNYSEGSYFYAIKPLNGNPINKGKFTVVK